jgi:hypothetical protein
MRTAIQSIQTGNPLILRAGAGVVERLNINQT